MEVIIYILIGGMFWRLLHKFSRGTVRDDVSEIGLLRIVGCWPVVMFDLAGRFLYNVIFNRDKPNDN